MSDMSFNEFLPMIIDSFAGGGGASTGIELALGRSPDVAINHSVSALALHAANHPETLHLDSNIWDVKPLEVTKGRKVGLLWASPDCKHFSKAKGGAPRDRNIRDLAWVVVDWAEQVKPDVILMENVEEFPTWGPVDNDGQPIKEFAGQTYELWVSRLRKAGYRCQARELRACDYGAPTIRKRWFFVARRDGRPITWPKPTHGDPKSSEVKKGRLLPWRTAAECIDWSIACPSIFDTSAQIKSKHGLASKRPLADNTLARIARGMKRYVIDAERPFLVNLTHGGRCEDLADPFKTITGAHNGEKALVSPIIANVANSKTTGRGPNAWAIEEPFRTVTTSPGFAAIAPHLMSLKGTARRSVAPDMPHPTVLAGGGHSALIAPHIMTMRNSAKPFNGADEPAHTITAGGAGLTLVAPILTYAQQGGGNRSIEDPHHTICASRKDQNQVIIPTIMGCGGRAAQSRPRAGNEPFATVTSKADACLASAFLAQHNKAREGAFNPGRPMDAPISTVTQTGSQQSIVAPWFAKYYGTGDGARHDDPLHTVTVKDRMGHMQAAIEAPPFAPEHEARARDVAEFLRGQGAWDGGEFVTLVIDGQPFVVVDIGMRMLTPRELFNAQGFPSDYVIDGVWDMAGPGEPTFKSFPKDVQVSCCGNSVCPPLAKALVQANCAHLIKKEAVA